MLPKNGDDRPKSGKMLPEKMLGARLAPDYGATFARAPSGRGKRGWRHALATSESARNHTGPAARTANHPHAERQGGVAGGWVVGCRCGSRRGGWWPHPRRMNGRRRVAAWQRIPLPPGRRTRLERRPGRSDVPRGRSHMGVRDLRQLRVVQILGALEHHHAPELCCGRGEPRAAAADVGRQGYGTEDHIDQKSMGLATFADQFQMSAPA